MVWIVSAAMIIVVIALVVMIVGNRLPREHSVTRVTYLNRSPGEVWRTISDFSAQVEWRADLKSVERLPPRGGRERWRETDRRGRSMTLETMEAIPHRRLVRRIADENLTFGGVWTMEIGEVGEVTSLLVNESGHIDNPAFRFMSRFLVGQKSTIDKYLAGVGKRLGVEEVTIMDG